MILGFVAMLAFAALADTSPPPGVLNPVVTQATIHATICVKGWTKTIRPTVAYTNALKKQQLTQRGYQTQQPAAFEEDHWIPLELGGHPTDPQNLWPQPWPEARQKDVLETALHRRVCHGAITLHDAQMQIRRWKPQRGER